MPSDRGAKDDLRQRRQMQRANGELPFTLGGGLSYVFDPLLLAFVLAVDITPDTTGILAFSGTALTTQYLTTSGSLGAVSVALDVDEDFSATIGNSCSFTTTKAFQVDAGTDVLIIGATQCHIESPQFKIDDPTGTLFSIFFSSALANVAASPGIELVLAGGDIPTGSGAGGGCRARGGTALGSNQNGGEAILAGGEPTGTGTSIARVRAVAAGGTANERFYCDLVGAKVQHGATVRIESNATGLGFFGATPIARPGTYTITNAPAAGLALDCNPGAYSGVGTASLTDLNDLRTKVLSLAGVVRQLIKHLGDTSGLGIIDETAY